MNLEREGATYPTGRWFGGPGMQLRGRQRPLLGPCGKAGSVFMGAPSSKERHAKVLVGKCQVCSEALFRMLVCKGPSYLPHTYDSYTIIRARLPTCVILRLLRIPSQDASQSSFHPYGYPSESCGASLSLTFSALGSMALGVCKIIVRRD